MMMQRVCQDFQGSISSSRSYRFGRFFSWKPFSSALQWSQMESMELMESIELGFLEGHLRKSIKRSPP